MLGFIHPLVSLCLLRPTCALSAVRTSCPLASTQYASPQPSPFFLFLVPFSWQVQPVNPAVQLSDARYSSEQVEFLKRKLTAIHNLPDKQVPQAS